jgi:type II secretory pathway component PulF
MPKYRYQATDARGNPVAGEVEAAGAEQARQKLAAWGLDAEGARLTEVAEQVSGAARLSSEEAVELASQLAQMTKAGLPLAPGLRAMAEEIRLLLKPESLRFLWLSIWVAGAAPVVLLPLYFLVSPYLFLVMILAILLTPVLLLPFYLVSLSRHRRVARVLVRLADRMDMGMSLEEALESQGRRFPVHVRGLILAGVKTGRLPEALEEFVAVDSARIELRRQVWAALAYPCVLLVVVVGLFLLCFTYVVPQFGAIFEEFEAELPFSTEVLLWTAGPGLPVVIGLPALVGAAIICLAVSGEAIWARRVLYGVPLLGPIWRWAGICNLSRLMALLLGQEVPMPNALRLTAAGLREPDLSRACREAAEEVEAGRSLSDCLGEFWQFPPSLRPLVAWGEQTSNPAAAFRAGAEMFNSRVRVRMAMLLAVFPPVVFVFIIGAVLALVWGLFSPLVLLIQCLS